MARTKKTGRMNHIKDTTSLVKEDRNTSVSTEVEQSEADSGASVATEQNKNISNEKNGENEIKTNEEGEGTALETESVDSEKTKRTRKQRYMAKMGDNYEPRIFKCPECEQAFDHRRQLNRHLMGSHGPKYQHKCQNCGKWFSGERSMNEHQSQCADQQKRMRAKRSVQDQLDACQWKQSDKVNATDWKMYWKRMGKKIKQPPKLNNSQRRTYCRKLKEKQEGIKRIFKETALNGGSASTAVAAASNILYGESLEDNQTEHCPKRKKENPGDEHL